MEWNLWNGNGNGIEGNVFIMKKNIIIGSHVSISGGLIESAKEANIYGANTFMVYTGAPQNSVRKPIDISKVKEAHAFMKKVGIVGFVVHSPYIVNLASFKDDIYSLSIDFLKKELERTELLGSDYLVLHAGAYTERSLDYGVKRIAEGLNNIFLDNRKPIICIETMAGKGTEIGRNFEEIKMIIDLVEKKEKIAVCFDTCHVHDSGYDIVENLDGVIKQFDEIIGLDLIKVFHINGSLSERGAKKDRHANIGAGEDNPKGVDRIGFEAIYKLVHSKYAEGRFLILETPWLNKKENLYKQEIESLKGM